MGKEQLVEAIEKAEKERYYTENIHCDACLRERLKQQKIDEAMYNKKLMVNTIRRLCKEDQKIAYINDMEIDVENGEVLGYEVDYDRYQQLRKKPETKKGNNKHVFNSFSSRDTGSNIWCPIR